MQFPGSPGFQKGGRRTDGLSRGQIARVHDSKTISQRPRIASEFDIHIARDTGLTGLSAPLHLVLVIPKMLVILESPIRSSTANSSLTQHTRSDRPYHATREIHDRSLDGVVQRPTALVALPEACRDTLGECKTTARRIDASQKKHACLM